MMLWKRPNPRHWIVNFEWQNAESSMSEEIQVIFSKVSNFGCRKNRYDFEQFERTLFEITRIGRKPVANTLIWCNYQNKVETGGKYPWKYPWKCQWKGWESLARIGENFPHKQHQYFFTSLQSSSISTKSSKGVQFLKICKEIIPKWIFKAK